jgi:hypothetical protein
MHNIARIDLSVFQNNLQNTNHDDIPSNLLEKVNYLKENFSCFKAFYDPKMIWEKKKNNKKDKQFNKVKNKFHIIIPDFTDNSLNKRKLVGLLNKLTEKNSDVIYDKIKSILENTEEHLLLIWSYVKTSNNNLYMNLLSFFDVSFLNESIDKLWNNYVHNKEWMPPDYVFENNLLILDDKYELYCNYVKWKKEIFCLNNIWIKLSKNIDIVLNDIYEFMITYMNKKYDKYDKVHKYIIDILLEQISKILKLHNNNIIVNNIKQLDITSFESSSKFLIYDILEKNSLL